jgi:hypothetical protein
LINFGVLPAGTYTVVFFEYHNNIYDPLLSHSESTTFNVRATTPVQRATWTRLKLVYR